MGSNDRPKAKVPKGNQIVSATFRAHGGLCSLSEGWFKLGRWRSIFSSTVPSGAGFFFGLYELLQPTRFNNPGSAAYKPPPRTVIAYGPSSGFPPPPRRDHPAPRMTSLLNLSQTYDRHSRVHHDGIETIERRQPLAGMKKVKRNQKALDARSLDAT